MTHQVDEIGLTTHRNRNTEFDQKNLGREPEEEEIVEQYPELTPGRALLNVRTGELVEIAHRMDGHIDTVGRKKNAQEEQWDWEQGTEEGQQWGGLRLHKSIGYVKRVSPKPNQHGEINVPLDKPGMNDITTVSPASFHRHVLLDNGEPQPYLLLERPEIAYNELLPGDTFDVIGFYWPDPDKSNRVHPREEIASKFPELVDVDYETTHYRYIPEFDLKIPWDSIMNGSNVVRFTQNDDGDIEVKTPRNPDDYHVSRGYTTDNNGNENFALLFDSAFDRKFNMDIKDCEGYSHWDADQSLRALDLTRESFIDMIETMTDRGYTFTVNPDVIEKGVGASGDDMLKRFSTPHVEYNTDEDVELSLEDILEKTFTEDRQLGDEFHVEMFDMDVWTHVMDGVTIQFNPDDEPVTAPAATADVNVHNTYTNTEDDLYVVFDAPKDVKSCIKALDYNDAHYQWSSHRNSWTMRAEFLPQLIENFTNGVTTKNGVVGKVPVSVHVDVLKTLADEEPTPVTVTREYARDSAALAGHDTIENVTWSDVYDYSDFEVPDEERTIPDNLLTGIDVENPDALSLSALNMTLSAGAVSTQMNVDLGDMVIDDEVPDRVLDKWQPVDDDDDDAAYRWTNTETGDEVFVNEVEGWGPEFTIHVNDTDMVQPEQISSSIADERVVVMHVMSQMFHRTQPVAPEVKESTGDVQKTVA